MISYQKPDAENFFSTSSIMRFAVSQDEENIVFCANLNGDYNLWALNPLCSFPIRLTTTDQRTDAIFIHNNPDGASFLIFTGDTDGDENMQILSTPMFGGQPVAVRSTADKRYFLGSLSRDGRRIYYSSNKDQQMYLNIYRYHMDTGVEETLIEGTGAANHVIAVGPSEHAFVYTKLFNRTNIPAHVCVDGTNFPLVPDPAHRHIVYQAQFVDDSTIVFITNYRENYSYLASLSLKTMEFKKLLGVDMCELRSMAWSESTRTIYLVGSHGVIDFLYRYDFTTGEYCDVPIPVEVIDQIEVSNKGGIFLLGSDATTPQNIFRGTSSGEWVQLTRNVMIGVDPKDLSDPYVLRYPSTDGIMIEAIFYPANPRNHNGHTIVWPHGGPQHAERRNFNEIFHYFSFLGYNVFAPNFRGSCYYGDQFHRMVEGNWGGGPRIDIVDGIKWLVEQKLADKDKLFAVGGSYGGYMVLLLMGRHSHWFKAGVDICGPCNLLTFIETVPDWWIPRMKEWIGDPDKDRDKLLHDSPITYKNEITKPMLIYHGVHDTRVSKNESDQIVMAMEERNVKVKYVVMEDEGHWDFTRETLIRMHKDIASFLAELL